MSSPYDTLHKKIQTREATICVLGLGYVGLPLLMRFREAGFPVLGVDTDPIKIQALNQGRSYIKHIRHNEVQKLITSDSKHRRLSTDYSVVSQADALVICVPTPLTVNKTPEMKFVTDTLARVSPYMKEGQLLALESTTYPGTTQEILIPLVKANGFDVGKNYFVVYSPEREDPANSEFSSVNVPKLVGGATAACSSLGSELYKLVSGGVVSMSSPTSTEMTKVFENVYRSVNIGLVNELKMLCDKMGIDVYEVLQGAASKPFGFMKFYPGPGVGGHCIPVDPHYLAWKAREYDFELRFIELAGQINDHMPAWVVGKTSEALNHYRKPLNGSRILILGLAYKKNVDDIRESPSLHLIRLFLSHGAFVDYHDPFVPSMPNLRKFDFRFSSVALTPDTLSGYDAVVVATDHDAFDFSYIVSHSQLVVDTRGVCPMGDNVYQA